MTDTQLVECIQQAVTSCVKSTFAELGISERVKIASEQDTFKKVEQILWNYPLFKQIILDKEEQIQEVLTYGLRTTSKSITEYHSGGGGTVQGLVPVQETVQEVVHALEADILWLKQTLEKIEFALDHVRKDANFSIIEEYYFHSVTRIVLAAQHEVDVKTLSKRKNTLVRQIALYLFPREAVGELMN